MLTKDAFVVMPFGAEPLDAFYRNVVQPLLESKGFVPRRVDEMSMKEQIVERIIHSIEDSDMIVCDLTGTNANVMYELGIAHSLTHRVTMISQNGQALPFDLKDYEVIFYDPDDTSLDSAFARRLNSAIDEIERGGLSNPVQKFSRMTTELMDVSVRQQRRVNTPHNVLSKLGSYVERDAVSHGEPYVIALTGASCLGKTVFANELAKYLNEHDAVTSVMSLDGYMKPRRFLEAHRLAGPCEEAHDLDSLRDVLISLIREKRDVEVPFFDHSLGIPSSDLMPVAYSPVIVLEGMTAFSARIEDLVHLRIFMAGKHQWIAKKLRFLVSLEQRNRSINNSRTSAEREFSFYKNFLDEKRQLADIVITVDDDWQMRIEHDIW